MPRESESRYYAFVQSEGMFAGHHQGILTIECLLLNGCGHIGVILCTQNILAIEVSCFNMIVAVMLKIEIVVKDFF